MEDLTDGRAKRVGEKEETWRVFYGFITVCIPLHRTVRNRLGGSRILESPFWSGLSNLDRSGRLPL